MCTNVFTHKHSELPACSFSIIPVQFVLKHVPARLTILTGSKTSQKIKITKTLSWPVRTLHSPLGLQIYFFVISENAYRIDYGEGVGVAVKIRVRE